MQPGVLTKIRSVLKIADWYDPELDLMPVFRGEGDIAVEFDADTWRDMGEPTTITLTLEPGDLLNES